MIGPGLDRPGPGQARARNRVFSWGKTPLRGTPETNNTGWGALGPLFFLETVFFPGKKRPCEERPSHTPEFPARAWTGPGLPRPGFRSTLGAGDVLTNFFSGKISILHNSSNVWSFRPRVF